jgi:hypothetical protein
MDDGYFVRPERLRTLSGTFDGRSDTPPELAGRLDGASTVRTGDPSVDGTIREDVTQFASELRVFGEALSVVAMKLIDNADTYEEGEEVVGGALDSITGELGPAGAADQQGSGLIANRLGPTS